MKKVFSTKWKGSKQPRKQRKYLAKAPLHLKKKLLSANLSQGLRAIHKTRNVPIRKGDKVKIMRGKFRGKEGKVIKVLIKQLKIYIESIQKTKQDGSKIDIPFRPSNLQITELNMEDKKRLKVKIETPKNKTESIKKDKNKK